jgi:DNA-binding transcriptional regulator GbsR (MarR family)
MAAQDPATNAKNTTPDAARIREAQDAFISAWGKMGSAWGISRTMAEVHALLYITGQALCTDDAMDRLSISRGNASMSLRALQDWGIIRRVHKRGDRKEYFEAESDVWTMFRTIARERKKREIDPLVHSLFEIRDLTGARSGAAKSAPHRSPEIDTHHARLDAMLQFIDRLDALSTTILGPEGAGLKQAMSVLSDNA